ncbi:hypothetical protein [Shinella sp.]|uniref:hypothetical protein n=1 Tax=Shinella sp. TaxID=1870904 RepID=UPI0029AF5ECB|nr:hypothetical protein [Shinella sp.]MDX3975542.1 hypothetical protein [Shinella sp.]
MAQLTGREREVLGMVDTHRGRQRRADVIFAFEKTPASSGCRGFLRWRILPQAFDGVVIVISGIPIRGRAKYE